ncbi:MAG: c-type cytochrome, partial [Maribacter sp.]|nr:c-type cytochrome [Maribacter sp.]
MAKYVSLLCSIFIVLFVVSCSTDPIEKIIDADNNPPTTEIPEPTIPEPVIEVDFIPGTSQRVGNPMLGEEYLIYGDYMSSGIPYDAFIAGFGESPENILNRTGDNAVIPPNYTAVTASNGIRVVAPNCISCHASTLNNEFIMGLGSHDSDFTVNRADNISLLNSAISFLYGGLESDEWTAYDQFRKSIVAIGPKTITKTRGSNPADRITQVLIAHRDKNNLEWSDEPLVVLNDEVLPTDVPAWWLLKKKNAMFYTALGRMDFCKSFIGSSLLTMNDVTKAAEVDAKMVDVLAYINSLVAPQYPFEVDQELADLGKPLFENNCASCHGIYGEEESYPNLRVSLGTIGTDPELSNLYTEVSEFNDYFMDWFNTGWFGSSENPLQLVSEGGYIAPPLDGIWATAPYFHNGSVPTLEGVLNSTDRPKYWSRTFDDTDIDTINVGWNYT